MQVDYVQTQGSHEKDVQDNANLAFDPATGANYPFTNANRGLLPWPSAGVISMIDYNSNSSLRSLQTAFTKRMSNHWQASVTYTLSWFYDQESQPVSGRTLVPFTVQDDLGGRGSYGLAATDQRHRAVFNGIWEVGHGFQVSGLHYLGAGIRSATSYGGDVRLTGGTFSARLRPDGTIVPRNAYIQPAQNRTDIRVQQRIPLSGRVSIDGIAEVFNVFNRPNYTIDTVESSATYLHAGHGTEPHRAGRLPIDVLRKLKVQSSKRKVVESRARLSTSFPLSALRFELSRLLYFLFFCSGLSGLIYQVVWVRVFGNVFGNTIHSTSLVVAVFMLGLGVGSYIVGAWADRRLRLPARIAAPNLRDLRAGHRRARIGHLRCCCRTSIRSPRWSRPTHATRTAGTFCRRFVSRPRRHRRRPAHADHAADGRDADSPDSASRPKRPRVRRLANRVSVRRQHRGSRARMLC